jgi:hypothetical protein
VIDDLDATPDQRGACGRGILQPWQIIFFTLGAMGLVLSVVVFFLVDEPPRAPAESTPFSAVLQWVWRERAWPEGEQCAFRCTS